MGQWGPVSAQAGAGRGAHPGGAAQPGGALGGCCRPAVARPASHDRAETSGLARRSCLAGDSRPVEGLEGRAEGARSSPRMHSTRESRVRGWPQLTAAAPRILPLQEARSGGRRGWPGPFIPASAASFGSLLCLLPCARPVLFLPASGTFSLGVPKFPNFQAHLASCSSVPMVEPLRSPSGTEINQTNLSLRHAPFPRSHPYKLK